MLSCATWTSGYRALPLPIGWTDVEPEKAAFVYFGALFLLGVFGWAGWRERKIWPVLIAAGRARDARVSPLEDGHLAECSRRLSATERQAKPTTHAGL